MLRKVPWHLELVGVDFVEVSLPYGPSGITSVLTTRTGLDFIGSIFRERANQR